MKNKNEGKKNIQIDDDVYSKLKKAAAKECVPVRHYLQEIINDRIRD